MTNQERWLVVGVSLLILFGSGARWYRNRAAAIVETASQVNGAERSTLSADSSAAAEEQSPVDLNRCGEEELLSLPGIGPVKARSILDWRERNGSFRRVSDLTRVRGIGPKTVARLGNRVAVVAAAAAEGKEKRAGQPRGPTDRGERGNR